MALHGWRSVTPHGLPTRVVVARSKLMDVRRATSRDYHRIMIAAAISSAIKIGSSTGGTSHSRSSNFCSPDMTPPFWLGGSAILSVTDSSRGGSGDVRYISTRSANSEGNHKHKL